MSSPAFMPLLPLTEPEPRPFLSLAEPIHEHIVRYVGGRDENDPESYGARQVVLVEAIPYYKELVLRWFDARYVTMKTIDQLRLRMSSAFAPRLRIFNASPVLIQTRLCSVCFFRSHFPFGLVQHMFDFHPSSGRTSGAAWAQGNRCRRSCKPQDSLWMVRPSV